MIKKILTTIAFTLTVNAAKNDPFPYDIAQAKSRIPLPQCQEMQQKIGQLMYINVDGFGSQDPIHPLYYDLIKKINVGGVLPHYNGRNIDKLKEATTKLQEISPTPLMIGIDLIRTGNTSVGLGSGFGKVGDTISENDDCFQKRIKLDAAVHRYIGINNPLGPTIEKNKNSPYDQKSPEFVDGRMKFVVDEFKRMGLETTIKHYPYTPSDYNLHRDSRDTKVDEDMVDSVYLDRFKKLKDQSGFLMTTHLLNSKVDPNNMATFSKIWIKKLREEVGFKGIVMTDALFMFKNYPETMTSMSRDFPVKERTTLENDDYSIFAVKSILAGHDMFFLESSSNVTYDIWKRVLKFSCSGTPMAEEFRHRVLESFDHIQDYKNQNAQLKINPQSTTLTDGEKLAKFLDGDVCKIPNDQFSEFIKKFESTPTNYTCNTCGQDPRLPSLQKLPTKELILKLSLDNLLNLLSSSYGDNYHEILKIINDDPNLKLKLINHAKERLSNPKFKEKSLRVLTQLNGWGDDNSYITSLINNGDLKGIIAYANSAKDGPIPQISPEQFEQFINLTQSPNQKNLSSKMLGSIIPADKITPELLKKTFNRMKSPKRVGLLVWLKSIDSDFNGIEVTDEDFKLLTNSLVESVKNGTDEFRPLNLNSNYSLFSELLAQNPKLKIPEVLKSEVRDLKKNLTTGLTPALTEESSLLLITSIDKSPDFLIKYFRANAQNDTTWWQELFVLKEIKRNQVIPFDSKLVAEFEGLKARAMGKPGQLSEIENFYK